MDQICSDLKKFGAGNKTESYGFNMAQYYFPEENSAIPLTLDHLTCCLVELHTVSVSVTCVKVGAPSCIHVLFVSGHFQ